MSKAEPPKIRFHEDSDLFREAIRFTVAERGFAARLIEKDYFCTVLLAYLSAAAGDDLVFKGGTCLTKVHSELYRLSEDLDYTISVPIEASRPDRSKRAKIVRTALSGLSKALSAFRVIEALKGANKSTQYVATVGYSSLVTRDEEKIKIEVSLREPLLMEPVNGEAQTALLNPLTSTAQVPSLTLCCIAKTEALAEKFRAALSRREPAVRDFYDIDYAVRKHGFRHNASEFIAQVRQKLAIPGNDPVVVSERRLADLRRQVEPELKPVLREKDFVDFDLEHAFKIVVEMAKAVG
jgi:predicted nucleotidyltransferase component of viral defense system